MRFVLASTAAAVALSSVAMAGGITSFTTYGDLAWGSSEGSLTTVAYDPIGGTTGVGSSGFWTTNVYNGSNVFTIGLKAQSYRQAMPTDGTNPLFGGDGSVDVPGENSNHLYNDGAGTYYGVNGVGDQSFTPPASDPDLVDRQYKWGYSWAVLVDGQEISGTGQYEIIYAFSKPGDSSPSVAFEFDAYDGANGGLNSASWQFGYNFFHDAGFRAADLGDYTVSISLKAWDGGDYWQVSPTGIIATNSITISSLQAPVVPGVGGIAALAGLGLAGRRRRR